MAQYKGVHHTQSKLILGYTKVRNPLYTYIHSHTIFSSKLMTIDESRDVGSVSPKDTSYGTFISPDLPIRASHCPFKKFSVREQQWTYGKLSSYQFPKESLSSKEKSVNYTYDDCPPSLYSRQNSDSPIPMGPTTPRGSVGSSHDTSIPRSPCSTNSPSKRGAYTHRRSTPLSLSSAESILFTSGVPTTTATTPNTSVSMYSDSFGGSPITLGSHCKVDYDELAFVGSERQSVPAHQTVKKVTICEDKVRRHSAQGRHSAFPLPMIDLDVVEQSMGLRETGVGVLGLGLGRLSLSSGVSASDDLEIIEDDEEEEEEDEDNRHGSYDGGIKIDDDGDVSIVDFLRESISSTAMRVLAKHGTQLESSNMGQLVDVREMITETGSV